MGPHPWQRAVFLGLWEQHRRQPGSFPFFGLLYPLRTGGCGGAHRRAAGLSTADRRRVGGHFWNSRRLPRALPASARPDAVLLHHLLQGHSDPSLAGFDMVVLLAADRGIAGADERG